MFQEFFKDTLISRFIKNLLNKTPIPLLNYVSAGDILIEGCCYLYNEYVIRCEKTGVFYLNALEEQQLVPSQTLYPSVTLVPGSGQLAAKFKVEYLFNNEVKHRVNQQFHSNLSYYDPLTHKYLGEYLRYLRGSMGLDLMPFYNCYNNQQIVSTRLVPAHESAKTYFVGVNTDNIKIVGVPIKFGKTYTVAIDSQSTVQLRALIYNPETGMIKVPEQSRQSVVEAYYSDRLKDSHKLYSSMTFTHPITYSVSTTEAELYNKEQYLYLAIQLDINNDSSIVVLEGDYTTLDALHTDKNTVLKHTLFQNLSLLQFNCRKSFAFSDRLVEYLLLNVVNPTDELVTNIVKTQKVLSKIDSKYNAKLVNNEASYGTWDSEIEQAVLRLVEKYSETMYLRDHDGHVNKDIEELLLKEGQRIDAFIS